jgi:hypothetical protein
MLMRRLADLAAISVQALVHPGTQKNPRIRKSRLTRMHCTDNIADWLIGPGKAGLRASIALSRSRI